MELIETRIEKKVQEIESKQARLDRESVQTERKIKTFSGFAWFFVILGGIVGIFGLFLFSIRFPATPNELGDFYSGTVGSLWSLAGLFFIYVAFLGQKKQLSLQQIELTNSQLEVMYTQAELKGQKEAMKAQNELLTQQKFESTFFKLMENHNSMLDKMKGVLIENIKYPCHGKECTDVIYQKFRDSSKYVITNLNEPKLDVMIKLYHRYYNWNSIQLSYYYRNLYHIFKFIHESDIHDKKRYANFMRAQFSPSEIGLLLCNCLSPLGEEKFKPFVIEYSLLKHLEDKELKDKSLKFDWYPKEAFGL